MWSNKHMLDITGMIKNISHDLHGDIHQAKVASETTTFDWVVGDFNWSTGGMAT